MIPRSLSRLRTGAVESGNSRAAVIGALRCTIMLPPQLTASRSAAAIMSTPAELARANASAAATVFTPTRSWLMSFMAVPAPVGPISLMLAPILLKYSWAVSKASSFPPTMIARVPPLAPGGPPEMGASRKWTPFASAAAAHALEVAMSTVLWSTTTCPGLEFAITPSSPRSRSREVRTSGRQTRTTSTCCVRSATEVAPFAPRSIIASTFDWVRVNTVRSAPFSRRLLAIPWPMLPRPINPTAIVKDLLAAPINARSIRWIPANRAETASKRE